MVDRILKNRILQAMQLQKAVVIYGARQVGKSSLLHMIWDDNPDVMWLNGEETATREIFDNLSISRLLTLLSGRKTLIIDEAQNILNIGLQLKRIKDNLPDIQIVATGSSSFDLANKINEPMTGRKIELKMFPLSYQELSSHFGVFECHKQLESRLIFGSYPEVVTTPGIERELLADLTSSYLYKDILNWENVKKSDRLTKLLQALAFQIGSQVSYSEIGKMCGLDNKTVERYIMLLEQAFIIFRLPSFARNLRNELKFSKKVYFYDLGIRNALIGNFNSLDMRTDTGALWENYLVSERIKLCHNNGFYGQHYFWRNQQQAEIDMIEEEDGQLHAYEFKWDNKKNPKAPANFIQNYPEATFMVVNRENYHDFLSGRLVCGG